MFEEIFNNRSLGGFFLIFIYMLGFINSELNNFQTVKYVPVEDIFTEMVFNNGIFQLHIEWNPNITDQPLIDIIVTQYGSYCDTISCYVYDLDKTREHIKIPDETDTPHDKACTLQLGCNFTTIIKTPNNQTFRSTTLQTKECLTKPKICSCRHLKYLPLVNLSAIAFQDGNEIIINWNIIPNITLPTKLKEVNFSIEGTSLKYVETNEIHRHHIVSIKKFNNYKTITNKTVIKLDYLPDDFQYTIRANVIDNRECHGRKIHYKIRDFKKATHYDATSLVLTVFIIILLLSIIAVVSHYSWKRVKKENPANNWRSVYHSQISTTRAIALEENLIYVDKDILEAQQNNKADNYEVSPTCVTIECEVGQGAFGVVYKARAQNLGRVQGSKLVAVKQLKKCSTREEIDEFLEEIAIMKSYGYHPNIVQLLGCCTIKEPILMIMEYIGHGNLLEYLHNLRIKYSIRQNFTKPTNMSSFPLLQQTGSRQQNNHLQSQLKYPELSLSRNSIASECSYKLQKDTNSLNAQPSTETTYVTVSQISSKSSSSITSSHFSDYVLDNNLLQEFAIQIAKGMAHLEELQITHRDLAARNILIDERKILKISDFGLSRNGVYVNTRARKLPLRWLAIEALRDHFFSSKSDVWAFGVVLWEIGTLGLLEKGYPFRDSGSITLSFDSCQTYKVCSKSAFPYSKISNEHIRSFLESGQRLDRPEVCSQLLYDIMCKCWLEEPDERLPFCEILKQLQKPHQSIYVDLNSLSANYIFPPSKNDICRKKVKE